MFGVEASLSQELIDQVRADVDRHLEKNPEHKYLQHITLTCIEELDKELSLKGYPPFEYAMIFRFQPGIVQHIHLDGASLQNVRHASLNVLVRGENATFEWYKTDRLPDVIETETQIKSLKFEGGPDDYELREVMTIPQVHWVTTSVPHRVVHTSDVTNLVCIRFKNNPSFKSLVKAWT